jgi:hypothetical protein
MGDHTVQPDAVDRAGSGDSAPMGPRAWACHAVRGLARVRSKGSNWSTSPDMGQRIQGRRRRRGNRRSRRRQVRCHVLLVRQSCPTVAHLPRASTVLRRPKPPRWRRSTVPVRYPAAVPRGARSVGVLTRTRAVGAPSSRQGHRERRSSNSPPSHTASPFLRPSPTSPTESALPSPTMSCGSSPTPTGPSSRPSSPMRKPEATCPTNLLQEDAARGPASQGPPLPHPARQLRRASRGAGSLLTYGCEEQDL